MARWLSQLDIPRAGFATIVALQPPDWSSVEWAGWHHGTFLLPTEAGPFRVRLLWKGLGPAIAALERRRFELSLQ